MRQAGLILVVALLLTAGGVGIGWLAAEVEFADEIAIPGAIGAEPPGPGVAVADAGKGVERRAPVAPLLLAAERSQALESEIARLRWQLAGQRRDCRPEEAPAQAEAPPPAVGPVAMISNPERPEPELEPEPAPPVAEPAFAPEREAAPPPPVVAAAESPALPTVPPPAVPAAPPPAPEPAYRPGQALSVPEAAVAAGDLAFLEGCWASSPFANPVTGLQSTKVYCFDRSGNGQMSFRGSDGVTCNAPIRARWESGRRLVLEEPRDGSCSNFGPWYREATTCSIGGDGRAQCNSYEFHRRFNYGTLLTRS